MREIATKQDLRDALDRMTLRLTLRVGVMLGAAGGVLLAAMPLLAK